MTLKPNSTVAPGWIGGFSASNPAFAYPDPDLTSLPMLDNMANIPRIQRQQAVHWPEFSWETKPGDPESRCFSRFATDISRIGYDDTGRIWSIICPQQGIVVDDVGALNVEVTVTAQRGWVDESDREIAAGMTVEGKVWFSPSAHQSILVRPFWDHFKDKRAPFPYDKENAIKVTTHAVQNPTQPIFPIRIGESKQFTAPDFAKHTGEAWTVASIEVEIGPILKRNNHAVDTFDQKVIDIFNQASGNMLKQGNVLTWNLWLTAPELVDREQWKTHAERWRHSIDVDHGKSPDGSIQTPPMYANRSPFKSPVSELKEFEEFVELMMSLL